jgi:hypothetical protein
LAIAFALAGVRLCHVSIKNAVISTGGGALAAVVERPPYFVFAFVVVFVVALPAGISPYPQLVPSTPSAITK